MPGQANLETILRTGQIVGGQYGVDKLIAKGGMAAVWSGVNLHTGKRIALKVILRSFASNGEAAELFRREALAASKINHPNVVNIFDVIDHEGKTCIVMELLDGETLGEYLARSGPLSLETTVALLLPAMRGVAAANAQGVVHRDLKPGNIFLCSGPDGRPLTTKVLDFGISVMMRRAGDTSIATKSLAMFGTPAYMAPEAIELSPNIDGRADVYGFGVLFFEALTGKLPFLGQPGADLLRRVLTEAPPKVTLYRPDLSSDIVQIIDCALAKNANDRFPDMEQLIRVTEQLQALSPLPPAEADFCATVLMAQAVNHSGPSSRAHLSATRALSSLASEPRRAAHSASVAQRWKPSPANEVTGTPRKNLGLRASRCRLNRRAAISAALVVFLMVTAWVTVPASSSDSGMRRGQAASASELTAPAPMPSVTPLPTPTREARSIDSVAIVEVAVDVAQPLHGTATPHPSDGVSRGTPTTRGPRAWHRPARPSTPRAGRLFRSDF